MRQVLAGVASLICVRGWRSAWRVGLWLAYFVWLVMARYVTSCGGATISSYELPSTAVAVGSRTGVAYTTGGGFSKVFERPSYQAAAVQQYLARHAASLPPISLFNVSTRAYPDVSLLGYNLLSFYANQNWINPFPGGGTRWVCVRGFDVGGSRASPCTYTALRRL